MQMLIKKITLKTFLSCKKCGIERKNPLQIFKKLVGLDHLTT